MIVKELREALKGLDDNLIVILQKDEEGNGYNEAWGVESNHTFDRFNEEVYIKDLTPELQEQGYTEDDVAEGEDCVVIYP